MRKRGKWLSWALIFTGLILALLLVLAINSEPLVPWFRGISPETVPQGEPDQGETRTAIWHDALGAALISASILALLVSHIGLLIAAARALNRPRTHAIRGPVACPQCEHRVQRDWRVCPYCGWELDKSPESLPVSHGSPPRG